MLAAIPGPPFNDLQIGRLALTIDGPIIVLGAIAAVRIAERRCREDGSTSAASLTGGCHPRR